MGYLELLSSEFAVDGYKAVEIHPTKYDGCELLLKHQTFNANRAIVCLHCQFLPDDLGRYLKSWRGRIARRVKFFPLFWGLGLQVILSCDRITGPDPDLQGHVAKFDNQWCIIQSLFLIDQATQRFRMARSWGQAITGQIQDRIAVSLSDFYEFDVA